MRFRAIDVDFDVHKLIEAERYGFDDTPNDALRRLLKLGEAKLPTGSRVSSGRRSWSGEGVTLPHGTLIRMKYNKRQYEGQIQDGEWVIGGQRFDSPSGAASAVGLTKKGKTTKLDGWNYWWVKQPETPDWTSLDSLRQKMVPGSLEDFC